MSSVAAHLVYGQNGLINHYTLVCKHSLILIAGIKQKQQESLWTCTVNWATEEAQTANRCFGVLI